MKTRNIFILSFTAIITLATGIAFGTYSGGTGEPNNPYQIADVNDLLTLAADTNDYGNCYIMTADVNMQGQAFTTAIIAKDTAFTGTFDGNGHKVTGFTIHSDSYVGLFGQINSGGSVKNLGLANFIVSSSSDSAGGLVAFNYGSISNCYSTGQVSGDSYEIGGLAGENNGNVSNCYSTGQVGGNADEVGGLVGENNGSINNCHFTGTVSSDSNSYSAGGLAGWNYGSISNCYSTGTVSGSQYIGGLAGKNFPLGSINNCYSADHVSGSYSVGGLLGWNDGNISNCYSMGIVSGSSDSDFIGGLVGMGSGSVSGSFWDMQTSGQTTSDGGGTGKMTADMKTLSTFTSAEWDFTNVWAICEVTNYPRLKWQIPAADWVCPNGVGMEDLAYLAQRWLENDCALSNNYCGGADMNASGTVDMKDFALFAANWLDGE